MRQYVPERGDNPHSPTFFDFLIALRRDWLPVALFILLGLVLAGVFLATHQPRFRAYAEFSVPANADLVDINAVLRAVRVSSRALGMDVDGGSQEEALTPEQAFAFFSTVALGEKNRQAFFEKVYVPSQGEAAEALGRQFAENVLVVKGADSLVPTIQVVVMDVDPLRAEGLVQGFVEQTMLSSYQSIRHILSEQVLLGREILDEKIEALRQMAEYRRQAYIRRLQDAYQLALAIDLKVPTASLGEDRIGAEDAPMYLRGTTALKAELEAVRNRRDNDPYIPELAVLMQQKNVLERLDAELRSTKFASVAVMSANMAQPFQPGKGVVLAVGAALGVLLAVLFVLTRLAWKMHRSRWASSHFEARG